jgi:hypothetical protein
MRTRLATNPTGWLAITALLVCTLGITPARAQLNTQHIRGLAGLKAGSQPPPHWYFILPLLYVYNTDTIRTADGKKLPINVSVKSVAYAGGAATVTTKKILGANYGYQILFPVGVNNLIQGAQIDENPGPGISDSAIVPIQLGWHFARADAIASYSLFLPTGRYTDGASNNTGYGMWGQEVAFGTTAYLTGSKQYHAATLASLTWQGDKEDSETHVGSALNLEGGVGGDFLKGGLTVGLAYYTTLKLSKDEIDGFPGILIRGKNKVFGLGPEATLVLAKNDTVYGFLRVNYMWEPYARLNTQGSTFSITLTFPFRPIKLK